MVCRAADRLSHLCVALQLSTTDFAQRLDLPKGKRLPRRLNEDLQKKILVTFPNVNPCWLFKGKGEVLWPVPSTSHISNNYVGINYGQCIQYITTSSAYSVVEQQLRANLAEKERLIQILMRRPECNSGEVIAYSHITG